MRVFGSNVYRVYHNGEQLLEGPARFTESHPEYDEHLLLLKPGKQTFTIVIHQYGVTTRMTTAAVSPFLQFQICSRTEAFPLKWQCKEETSFKHLGRRLNDQLGWMEFCDMRTLSDWKKEASGPGWVEPIVVDNPLPDASYRAKTIASCLALPVTSRAAGEGRYTNRLGYEDDDPPVRFMLRDQAPSLPPEGCWYRFDFGKIGLYRPRIRLDVPEGTVVEAGYSEGLTDGRVYPIVTLSASTSCSMDRWITKAGAQTLETYAQRGFRYLELHVAAPKESIHGLCVEGEQRSYFSNPTGSFACSDPKLNEVWQMCIETLQSNSEDVLVDSPTRERGQWLGDIATVGLENVGVSFGDMFYMRRSLLQAADCRSKDGLVAALYPGEPIYITSFALLWVSACVRYYRLTGDRSLLEEAYASAVETVNVFWARMTERGIAPFEVWDFLDWGHLIAEDEINVSLNLLLLQALRDLRVWEEVLGRKSSVEQRIRQYQLLKFVILRTNVMTDGLLAQSVSQEADRLPATRGFHANVLGCLLHLFDAEAKQAAVAYIKSHLLACFPNNPAAPRLSSPKANNNGLITPYFSHFYLQVLWEAGEAEFVLEQYRVCWGWMLSQGANTLLEVFDSRWSHCHVWSGCPAWQLSRNVLGLVPDDSGDPVSFNWRPQPGMLDFAQGTIPLLHQEGVIDMQWRRKGEGWAYSLTCGTPLHLTMTNEYHLEDVEVDGSLVSLRGPRLRVNKRLHLVFYKKSE